MPERVCIIHVGTHKTGTTSLQYFLQSNQDIFEREGLRFSRSGWYGVVPGNHNVAWNLRDGIFDEHVTTLIDELRAQEAQHAILSAEDFSLLHAYPQALERFVTLLQSIGFTPKILVYLRAQAGYAESMYAERIKHGNVRSFQTYLGEILAKGLDDVPGAPIEFRYDRMLATFASSVNAENILARPYLRYSNDLEIFHDFLGALSTLAPSFRPAGLHLELHHTRINDSLTFGMLLGNAYVMTHPDLPPPVDPNEFFQRWCPELPPDTLNARFSLLSRLDVEQFERVFHDSNMQLERTWGIRLAPTVCSSDDATTAMERRVLDRCIAAWRSGAA